MLARGREVTKDPDETSRISQPSRRDRNLSRQIIQCSACQGWGGMGVSECQGAGEVSWRRQPLVTGVLKDE